MQISAVKNTLKYTIIIGTLFFTVALTLWGLVPNKTPLLEIAVNWQSFYFYRTFFCISFALIFGIAYFMRISSFYAGFGVALLFAIASDNAWSFFVAIFFFLSSFTMGSLMLDALKISRTTIPVVEKILIGSAIFGFFVLVSAAIQIHYPGVYAIILLIPVLFYFRNAKYSHWHNIMRVQFEPSQRGTVGLLLINTLIAAILFVYFLISFMPEVGSDAMSMHMYLTHYMTVNHKWTLDAITYWFAFIPILGDCIYSIAYGLGGETSARLINFGFIIIITIFAARIAKGYNGTSLGPRISVLLFLSFPLTLFESSTLYIESIWTAFCLAGSLSVLQIIFSNSHRIKKQNFVLGGFFLGAAGATKALTGCLLIVLFILLLLYCRSWLRRRFLASIVTGLTFFCILCFFTFVKAWVFTGNPVFPFLNHIFKSPLYSTEKYTNAFMFDIPWTLLYDMTFSAQRYGEMGYGGGGFQWLLLFIPVALITILSGSRKNIILIAVVIIASGISFVVVCVYLRYLFPYYAIFAGIAGAALSLDILRRGKLRSLYLLVIIFALILNFTFIRSASYGYSDLRADIIFDNESVNLKRRKYLDEVFPIRNAIEVTNLLNRGNRKVLFLSPPEWAGINSPVMLYPGLKWQRFQQNSIIYRTFASAAEAGEELSRVGVEFIICNLNFVDYLTEKEPQKNLARFVPEITDLIYRSNNIAAFQLKLDYQFLERIIASPAEASWEEWDTGEDVMKHSIDASNFVLGAFDSISKEESVEPRSRYLCTMELSAISPEKSCGGRIQIVWLDEKRNLLRIDAKLFAQNVMETGRHNFEFTAPDQAWMARFYVVNHTQTPILLKSVEIKRELST